MKVGFPSPFWLVFKFWWKDLLGHKDHIHQRLWLCISLSFMDWNNQDHLLFGLTLFRRLDLTKSGVETNWKEWFPKSFLILEWIVLNIIVQFGPFNSLHCPNISVPSYRDPRWPKKDQDCLKRDNAFSPESDETQIWRSSTLLWWVPWSYFHSLLWECSKWMYHGRIFSSCSWNWHGMLGAS